MRRLNLRSDAGFTLVELLLVTVIMVIVVPAMTAVIVLSFNTSSETADRVRDSSSLQVAAAYFASDVQSAKSVSTTATDCLPAQPSGHTYSTLVRLEWQDPVSTDPNNFVTDDAIYYTDAVPGQSTAIRRASCGTTTSDIQLVDALSSTPAAVTCAGGCGSPTEVDLKATTATGLSFTLTGQPRSS